MSKPAGVIIFILALFSGVKTAAEERIIPVLEKRADGLRYTGREISVPASDLPSPRIFGFDRPSLEGLGRTKEHSAERLLQGAAALADSWHVVLVRVSFETDRSGSLTSMRTGGGFDLEPGTSVIDPAPHNAQYFDSHMEALARYYEFQSCGAVEMTWDILPEGEGGSYKLSDLADYGPGGSGQWTVDMLVRFVHDAIAACDDSLRSDGYPVRLSDYDAIVLAHAGANLQSDVLGNSPNDVPSFYARLGEGDEIIVEDGGHIITELSVVPETAIQDGYNGGIAAVLAHEFGHQLGLPDLYDIYTNSSTVGVFDNMDSGGQLGAFLIDEEGALHYAEGFIPGGLSGWSKYFLGWMSADTVKVFDDPIALSASGKCPSKGVRVEMAADEYWLIENRAAELDGLLTGFIRDEVTGVILGTGNCMNCEPEIPDEIVWGEFINGYDYLLPTESLSPGPDWGPGILVWHVDEYFIERRWEANEVNSRWPFGVSLIEANGVVDLGDPTSRFGLGWYDDAFYEGNAVEMTDSTLPPAWSNWQVQTGLSLEGVSGRDTLMTFAAGCRERAKTRYVDIGEEPARFGSLPVAGQYGALLVGSDGYGYLAGTPDPVFDLYAAAPPQERGEPMTPASRVYGFSGCGDGFSAVIVAADVGGTVHVFDEAGWTECPSWPVVMDTLSTFPVPVRTADGTFLAVAELGGAISLIRSDGDLSGTPVQPDEGFIYQGNLVVEKNLDDEAVAIFALGAPADGGGALLYRYRIASGELIGDGSFPVGIPLDGNDLSGDIFLAGGDMLPDAPGSEIWVTAAATGRIVLAGSGGVISDRRFDRPMPHPPALQDLSGDGRMDLVLTDGRTIYAVGPSGANVRGWPRDINSVYVLPVGLSISVPLVTASNDRGSWVFAGTDAGILFIFDNNGDLLPGWPRKTACSFSAPVDLTSYSGNGYFSWFDLVFNDEESDFGQWRPEGGRARWQRAPFGDIDISGSWTAVYGGPDRDSFVLPSSGFEIAQPPWTELDRNLVIYPNPSNGERVSFHFEAPDEGEAWLGIMTLEGEKLLEKSMSLIGGQAEFAVPMADRASGIYICRLVIRSGGRTIETTRKFAIVN